MTCGQNFEHVIFFWLPLSVTERLSRRQRTFTGR